MQAFADFQNKDSTFAIVARPMDADINNVPENLQMEVIELLTDSGLKSQFNNIALTDFYTFYLVEEKLQIYTHFQEKSFVFSAANICVNSFFRR
jgi:hypothetical protein